MWKASFGWEYMGVFPCAANHHQSFLSVLTLWANEGIKHTVQDHKHNWRYNMIISYYTLLQKALTGNFQKEYIYYCEELLVCNQCLINYSHYTVYNSSVFAAVRWAKQDILAQPWWKQQTKTFGRGRLLTLGKGFWYS